MICHFECPNLRQANKLWTLNVPVADIWILTVLNCLSDFCGLLCLLTRKMLNKKSVDKSFTEVHNLKSLLKGIHQNRSKP